jgi:DNA-binding MarR family transcriptional regulator
VSSGVAVPDDVRTASSASAERLVELFGRFGPAYGRLMARGRGRGGARNPATWQQLRLLELLRVEGQLPMSRVGAGLGVTARNVTSLVDRLEAARLVRRVPHDTDRRVTLLELTDRGRRLNQRLFAGYRSRALRLFESLSPDDRAALERIMERLIEEVTTLSDPAEGNSVR